MSNVVCGNCCETHKKDSSELTWYGPYCLCSHCQSSFDAYLLMYPDEFDDSWKEVKKLETWAHQGQTQSPWVCKCGMNHLHHIVYCRDKNCNGHHPGYSIEQAVPKREVRDSGAAAPAIVTMQEVMQRPCHCPMEMCLNGNHEANCAVGDGLKQLADQKRRGISC